MASTTKERLTKSVFSSRPLLIFNYAWNSYLIWFDFGKSVIYKFTWDPAQIFHKTIKKNTYAEIV